MSIVSSPCLSSVRLSSACLASVPALLSDSSCPKPSRSRSNRHHMKAISLCGSRAADVPERTFLNSDFVTLHKKRAATGTKQMSQAKSCLFLVYGLTGVLLSACTPNRAYRDQGPDPSQRPFVRDDQLDQFEPYISVADKNHHFDF